MNWIHSHGWAQITGAGVGTIVAVAALFIGLMIFIGWSRSGDRNKPIFLASALVRYWKIWIIVVVIELLRHVDAILFPVGPPFFVLEFVFVSIICAFLARHVSFKDTIDAFVQKQPKSSDNPKGLSSFVIEWNKLDGATKVKYAIQVWIALLIVAGLISLSVAK